MADKTVKIQQKLVENKSLDTSSSDEMGFEKIVFMRVASKFV